MGNDLALKDPLAQLVWRLYLLRAESVLSVVSASTRMELTSDLTNHLSEMMPNDEDQNTERKRLKVALARMGDPRDFLAPLLAAADIAPTQIDRLRSFLMRAGHVLGFLAFTISMGFALVLCVAIFGASVGSLFDPDKIGIFDLSESSIRIGTNSGLVDGTYHQMLAPLSAITLAIASVAATVAVLSALRSLLLRLVALTYTASLRILL